MQKKAKPLKIFSIISYSFLILLMVLVAGLIYMKSVGKVPALFGNSYVRIISPSMEPEIPTGSYILVKKIKPEGVKVGDVILFYSSDENIYMKPNTHRVVEIYLDDNDNYSFVTKGDNNPVNDSELAQGDNLIGVYVKKIPFLTKISDVLNNRVAFFLLVLIPALALFTSEINDFTKKIKKVKEQELIEKEIERLKKIDENKQSSEKTSDLKDEDK